ncbi:MAG TPA: hypothetical protein VGJ92_10600 [Methanocella sp.]|jgi:hypothetical protein
MSQEKNHPVLMDMTGRILSLEQRVKGLYGRIAAIEARISCPGNDRVPEANEPFEDFVPAANCLDRQNASDYCTSDDQQQPAVRASTPVDPGTGRKAKPATDMTGLIAGAILIGAGILLLTGNVETIKNPLVAIGCGILLIAGGIKR